MVCLNFLVNISSVLVLELPPAVLAASFVGGDGFVLCSSSTCSKYIMLLMPGTCTADAVQILQNWVYTALPSQAVSNPPSH